MAAPALVSRPAKWLLKRLLHFSGVASAARLLRKRRFDGLRVISFHRVMPDDVGPDHYGQYMGEPTVGELRRLLEHLRRWFKFITPRDYCDAVSGKRPLEPYSMMLTFDDGYVDLHDRLLPLLESLRLPATVFVNTAAMGGEVLWFQKLFAAVLFTPLTTSPPGFDVPPRPTGTASERAQVLSAFGRLQKKFATREWEEAVPRICEAFRWDGDLHDQRFMTWTNLEALRRSPWVTVGGHTVRHPYLPLCEPERLRDELVDCRAELRQRLGLDFLPFAYPNGGFDRRVVEAVREAAYDCAFVMAPGLNTLDSERFRLFRHYVSPNIAECSYDLTFRVPMTSRVRE